MYHETLIKGQSGSIFLGVKEKSENTVKLVFRQTTPISRAAGPLSADMINFKNQQ